MKAAGSAARSGVMGRFVMELVLGYFFVGDVLYLKYQVGLSDLVSLAVDTLHEARRSARLVHITLFELAVYGFPERSSCTL